MKITLKTFSVSVLSLCLLCSCAPGVKTVKGNSFDRARHMRIAVLNFAGPDKDAEASFPEMMVAPLMEAGFDVIERSQLKKISEEQKLNISGAVSMEEAIKIGKLAGVKAVLIGNFNSHKKETKTTTTVVRRNWIFRPNRVVTYGRVSADIIFTNISARIVDVETGEVVLSTQIKDPVYGDQLEAAAEEMADSIKKSIQ